jgi:hypothetical protein
MGTRVSYCIRESRVFYMSKQITLLEQFAKNHTPTFTKQRNGLIRYCVGTLCAQCCMIKKCKVIPSVSPWEYANLKNTNPEYFI